MRDYPPIAALLSRYTCDPDEGVVRLAVTGKGYRRSLPIGHAIGHVDRHGYLITGLTFDGKTYSFLLHRLAWAIYHQEYAPDDRLIDHINRVRTDNRRGNLRLVDARANCLNSAATRKDESVPCGVSKLLRHGRVRFQAGKTYKGRRYYLGIFDTQDEAARAVSLWRPM